VLFWRKSCGRPWTQFFSNELSDCKNACRQMVSMSDELKERNILKLILIVRFACATLDVGHPIYRAKYRLASKPNPEFHRRTSKPGQVRSTGQITRLQVMLGQTMKNRQQRLHWIVDRATEVWCRQTVWGGRSRNVDQTIKVVVVMRSANSVRGSFVFRQSGNEPTVCEPSRSSRKTDCGDKMRFLRRREHLNRQPLPNHKRPKWNYG
jgi:hypothetical protein